MMNFWCFNRRPRVRLADARAARAFNPCGAVRALNDSSSAPTNGSPAQQPVLWMPGVYVTLRDVDTFPHLKRYQGWKVWRRLAGSPQDAVRRPHSPRCRAALKVQKQPRRDKRRPRKSVDVQRFWDAKCFFVRSLCDCSWTASRLFLNATSSSRFKHLCVVSALKRILIINALHAGSLLLDEDIPPFNCSVPADSITLSGSSLSLCCTQQPIRISFWLLFSCFANIWFVGGSGVGWMNVSETWGFETRNCMGIISTEQKEEGWGGGTQSIKRELKCLRVCVSVCVCVCVCRQCVHARQIWIIMFQRAPGDSLCAALLQVIKYPVLWAATIGITSHHLTSPHSLPAPPPHPPPPRCLSH